MVQIGAYPPNIEQIREVLPVPSKGVVFTYGRIIYNPDGVYLDKPLEFHEATHSLQQDTLGAEKWWEKYLADEQFRYSQEIEAYHNQYNKFCVTEKDRNKRVQFLYSLAQDLSSPLYGTGITFSEAVISIRNGKKQPK